jgi:hypothetical protein
MIKKRLSALFLLLAACLAVFFYVSDNSLPQGAPPYDVVFDDVVDVNEFSWINHWTRPVGPPRVGLQVGHWKNDELPDELAHLHGNTGASGGGKAEWEVNLAIAELTKTILVQRGIEVDILPATIPPSYWADAFVAIHADGNLDSRINGYKIAASWRDMTKKANTVIEFVGKEYQQSTGLIEDPEITTNMRGYYAFSWWRRLHAVHPMTPSIILETGFLTSPLDRRIIVNKPELAAQGLANGLINYLESESLL